MPLPDVVVNRSSPVPLYFQVAEQLERAILEGALVPGDRIGNEVALADSLGLSRPTLRQAIQMLSTRACSCASAGSARRSCTRRCAARSSSRASTTTSSARDATRRPVLLSLEQVEADEESATRLNLPTGTVLWELHRSPPRRRAALR